MRRLVHDSYAARAFGVAALWGVGALPVALGVMRCPVATFFHAPCPGCGMTRAIWQLLQGDVTASLHLHALAVPSVVASSLVMVATTWATLRRGSPTDMLREPIGRVAAGAFVVVQAAVLGYYIARIAGALGGLPPVV